MSSHVTEEQRRSPNIAKQETLLRKRNIFRIRFGELMFVFVFLYIFVSLTTLEELG